MTRRRLLSTALLAASSLTAALAAAVPVSADPAATAQPSAPVAVGDRVPRAVSLVGTELRLANGKVWRLPAGAGRWPVLLGTSPRGWVVASGRTFRLVRRDGDVDRIGGRNNSELYVTEALSDDGTRTISAAIDRAGGLSDKVRDLDGRVVLNGWYSYVTGDVLDAADGLVYVGGRGGLRAIEEGTDTVTRLLHRPVSLVDAARDTVFVGGRRAPGRVGPTSLTDPGHPTWRARFEPVAISPDRRHVVGRDGTVRAMQSGRVVRRVPVPAAGAVFRYLGWGSPREVLLERTTGGRSLLMSCAVPRGACGQVGSTTGRVSLPTTHAGPLLQP